MELSLRWAERSLGAFGTSPFGESEGKALFGIVQGGDVEELRLRSARELISMDFNGYALGGLAVGESPEAMLKVLDSTVPALPESKPRYLMGVGSPGDILESVSRGIDMFDCVMPTRAGRHGLAFTRRGKVNLRNARHAEDPRPLDEESDCPASRDYSRAYLHHLFRCGEPLGASLLSWSNVFYYQELMRGIREAIWSGRFADFRAEAMEGWRLGDVDAI